MFGEAMAWYVESLWAFWRGTVGIGGFPLILLCLAIWFIFFRRGGCCGCGCCGCGCCGCGCRCGRAGDAAEADG